MVAGHKLADWLGSLDIHFSMKKQTTIDNDVYQDSRPGNVD